MVQNVVASGNGNEFVEEVTLTDNGPRGNAPTWKAAGRYAVVNKVESPNAAAGFAFHDMSAVIAQGWVTGGVQWGRVGGGVSEVIIEAGSDGMGMGHEVGIVNFGSEDPDIDSRRAKIAFWTGCHRDSYDGSYTAGGKRATAVMAIAHTLTQGGSFLYGFVLRHIAKWFFEFKNPGEPGCIGILFRPHANWGEAIRLPSGVPITAWTADGQSVMPVLFMNQWDQTCIGQGSKGVAAQFPEGVYALELGPPDVQGFRNVRVRT